MKWGIKALCLLSFLFLISPVFAKFCVHCGGDLPEIAKFCSKCGQQQEQAKSAEALSNSDIWSELEIIDDWETFLGSSNFITAANKFPEYQIKVKRMLSQYDKTFTSLTDVEKEYLSMMNEKWEHLQAFLNNWNQSIKKKENDYQGKALMLVEKAESQQRNKVIDLLRQNQNSKNILSTIKRIREQIRNKFAIIEPHSSIDFPKDEPLSNSIRFVDMSERLFIVGQDSPGKIKAINTSTPRWFEATLNIRDLEQHSDWKKEYLEPIDWSVNDI